jgi:dipeptidyl aminopeptidase/acylaminoacyl peptidase
VTATPSTSTNASWSADSLVYDLTPASDPQISPDGEWIVYVQPRVERGEVAKSTSDLFLVRRDGSDSRRLTYGGKRNSQGRWSPDGSTIAFVSDRDGEDGVKSRLLLLPVGGGGDARPLAGHLESISGISWSPDGRTIAYLLPVDPDNPAGKPRPKDAPPPVRVTSRLDYKLDGKGYLGGKRSQLFLVDVETGTTRKLTEGDFDHGEAEWSPDGRTISTRVAGPEIFDAVISLIDVATGSARSITPENGTISVFSWSPDGSRILYGGDTHRTWQSDLWVYTLASGETRRLTDDLPFEPDSFPAPHQPIWLDAGTALLSGTRAGGSGLYTVDVESATVKTVVTWQATQAGFSHDRTNRYIVQARTTHQRTGEIVVVDRTDNSVTVVVDSAADQFASRPELASERFTVERAGLEIEGWILFPPGFDPSSKYPVILDIHGGPNGHYGWGFNNTQQQLASNGYIVVFSNPRGSNSYGRDFTQRVIRDWGGEDYQDLMLVIDTVLERPYADETRTGIYGYSYGGYMTSWIIGHTQRFQACVCGAPCFNLVSMYGTSDIGYTFGKLQWGGTPQDEFEWLHSHSPSTYAHRATTPTLIVHGEADDRCPIGQGEEMFVTLKEAGCEVEFARYPGASHGLMRLSPPEHRADYLQRVLDWFDGHLKG